MSRLHHLRALLTNDILTGSASYSADSQAGPVDVETGGSVVPVVGRVWVSVTDSSCGCSSSSMASHLICCIVLTRYAVQ